MSPNLRIAYRFLTARKRAMLMSLSCTVLGVGLFALTQATTGGFRQFFVATILGANGAIRIEDRIQYIGDSRALPTAGGQQNQGVRFVSGVADPIRIQEALKDFSIVTGSSGVLRASVGIQNSFTNGSGDVFGIVVDEYLTVSDLGQQVVYGNIAEFREARNGVLIGTRMAERLALTLGSPILLTTQSEQRPFVVKGIYETGIEEIDKARLYIQMSEARSLLRKPTGVSFLQVNLSDPEQAPELAIRLQDLLGHSVKSWQEREVTWLRVFKALGLSSAITVSVFTLIAGLAMFNTLAMIVMEKTKDIAILRSMGYERGDVTRIFLWQAAIVMMIGSILGALVGVVGTYVVSQIPLPLTGIFKTETYQVYWSVWHYVEAVGAAAVMVMLASLIPARRAARLEPGDIVRGTAQ